ncbi:hypothetical protein BCV70DRAFT_154808 [Testicularia cyperi]|uniref:Enoyl reductase (ER) domain-containing protein n=1 Tax=Testicularia cyperi TaxID=1882483 RepID=A0A317XY81_9BASI|nr:hypothetical protein BCV70DRAFT_154808 [Testicularia cyperi]
MTKHSLMDSILNRPSQRYTESATSKASQQWAPPDLPNASTKPDSILAGNMFRASGPGSLAHGNGSFSQTPSVSGMSNASRFSLFRKKKKNQPSISGGSIFNDGSSSIAPTDVSASPRKSRWWESGSAKKKYSSRPPSVAGSIFSEPEQAGPPGFPRLSANGSSVGHNTMPLRSSRSDYGGPSSRTRYSSAPVPPPVPSLKAQPSMSSLRKGTGVAPLGQQTPSLMRQSSRASIGRSSSAAITAADADPSRPVSPAASMGRANSVHSRTAPRGGSSDWNSFVKSMAGTEVAKTWESMPTLAPKPSRSQSKRSSTVAERVKKELQQEAQYEQIQRDPGIVHQDLLSRAASQVIGEMPMSPISQVSALQEASIALQPGQIVAPISPVRSTVASNSSLHLATATPPPQQTWMATQSAPVMPASLGAPVTTPAQAQPPLPMQAVVQTGQQAQTTVSPVPQSYHVSTNATQAVLPQIVYATMPGPNGTQSAPIPVQLVPLAQTAPVPTHAPVATAPEVQSQPLQQSTAHAPIDPRQISAIAPAALAAGPPLPSPPPPAAQTTAEYLASQVEEEEASTSSDGADTEAIDAVESDDETPSSSEDESGLPPPSLDVVAEEDEETSSVGHDRHHEMRSHGSIKGKGFVRNYDAYIHSRQASAQSQSMLGDEEERHPQHPLPVLEQELDHAAASVPASAIDSDASEVTPPHAGVSKQDLTPAPVRPAMVTRMSSGTDYQSATSGPNTPTSKELNFADELPRSEEEGGTADDGVVDLSKDRPISLRSGRSSRPGTAQRRLSDISLGTSFAISGFLGGRSRSSSRRLRLDGDGDDSDSGADASDDDAELKARAFAEQDRLRRMNVGEDFFGPSLSNILDRFDKMNHSDTTVSRLGLETRDSFTSSKARAEASLREEIAADAQKMVNEVRQKRAEELQRSKDTSSKRNSDGASIAPSLAAVWLLNQKEVEPITDGSAKATDQGGMTTSRSIESGLAGPHSPLKPADSVLNRPRPKSKRPQEMGGLAISEGKLESASPTAPAEDTRNTLPAAMLLQQGIPKSASSPVKLDKAPLPVSELPSRDKPAPAKSAMKPKSTRSLADTLFGISLRSPGKDKEKKEKKEKNKHKRRVSVDSISSRSVRSDRSMETDAPKRSSIDASTAPSLPVAVSVPAGLSARAAGKQRQADDGSGEPSEMVASETVGQFTTPMQSMANLRIVADENSPDKFHTAHDLKALANPDTTIPVYPTELAKVAAQHQRPEHQRQLSEQMRGMNGFGSFSLPSLQAPDAQEPAASVQALSTSDSAAEHAARDVVRSERQPSSSSISVGDSVQPISSEVSVASTAQTSPTASEALPKAIIRPLQKETNETAAVALAAPAPAPVSSTAVTADVAQSVRAPKLNDTALDLSEKKLPLPPPPAPEELMAPSVDDRTPIGKPQSISNVGINLIPPTPPALESRNSYTSSSKAPSTPTIAEQESSDFPQRPSLVSRSSSQRTAGRSTDAHGQGDSLSRSRSVSTVKKSLWTEYTGKGLSLPPGLVATTIDSSKLRRMSAQEKKAATGFLTEESPKKASSKSAAAQSKSVTTSASMLDSAPTVTPTAAAAPDSISPGPPSEVSPTSPVRSPSSKSRRRSASPGGISPSSSMSRIMAGAPPVPPVPASYQGPPSVSSSSSRLYAPSGASSELDFDSRSPSPAPSAVPSQSGRSNASHVSSSVHSSSYRGSTSPRPEYSYVNVHELSPYAKKMRALSPSPAVPTLSQTSGRHSLMSAINEWESQVPESMEEQAAFASPYPSRPHSPSPYPTLPASTISRGSSIISAVSSPAVVRNAPLGASTNQYLHPPVPRSRLSLDAANNAAAAAAMATATANAAASSISSSPSASQSAVSLTSTIPTSMPTVPTSYRPNKDPKRFSTNVDDLLNSRTTMQTISVSSGAFATRSKSVVKRKKSVDLNGDRRSSVDIPEHLQDELSLTTLSLSAHTPPPRKINSHQVLVQVIAVGIDEMDKLLLRERARHDNAFGFVPGRSFCGRVVECGYEVKKMRKGDIVFGLQDSRKSGALAEFMTIDHNLICHAPSDCLTTEQIAALPSAGVMAHQIVRNHCAALARGARVLILNAHDGVGLLTMQESVGLGLIIVAQCPPSISDGVAVCQANGAHEVVLGEPLWAINSLHESSFDLVIDTVGGRKIYDASRRILSSDGQYCTCFGDEHGTANPNLKSHFRSLRRAFFKKDKKNIGYEWVGVDNGEDCREALEAVKRAAEAGNVCPRLRSILPFADAPRAFDPTTRYVDEEPGAIVVRVS